jgi:muconolactone delta-isomerase
VNTSNVEGTLDVEIASSKPLEHYDSDHWLQIMHRVTAHIPPAIGPAEMELLDTVFEGIAAPFRLFKQAGRKNLLNYNFILFKLLQLVGRHDALCYFPQLKTRAKWLELDRVWTRICEYQQWALFALEEPPKLVVKLTPRMWLDLDTQALSAAWEFAEQGPGAWKKKVHTHSYCNKAILKTYKRTAARTLATQTTKALPWSGRATQLRARACLRRRK